MMARTRTSIRSVLTLALSLVAVLVFVGNGCAASDTADTGESTGYTNAGVYPGGITSIAVPIFANRTLNTGLEREITDALIKELQLRTPYTVTVADEADTVLTGVITGAEKTRLSRQRGSGLAQELLHTVTVDFEWKDLRTGRVIVEKQRFEAADIAFASRPINDRAELAEYSVAAELARDIVSSMRNEW